MSNTTYAHLKIEGKDWLVPEPIVEKPNSDCKIYHGESVGRIGQVISGVLNISKLAKDFEPYHKWTDEKTNWLEIHPDHLTEFEGRKGLVEGKDFEAVPISKTMPNGWYANNQVGEQQKNTDNKRSVAIPMTQTQTTEERAREILRKYIGYITPGIEEPTYDESTIIAAMLEFVRTGEKEVDESQSDLWDKVCTMAVMDANIYRVHKTETIKKLEEKFTIIRTSPDKTR